MLTPSVYVSLTLTGKKLPTATSIPLPGIGNFNGDTVLFDDVKDSKFETSTFIMQPRVPMLVSFGHRRNS